MFVGVHGPVARRFSGLWGHGGLRCRRYLGSRGIRVTITPVYLIGFNIRQCIKQKRLRSRDNCLEKDGHGDDDDK